MAVTHSDELQELATALALAQAEIEGATRASENPHFRHKYADLASTWDACREALTKHGLSVAQFPRFAALTEESWVVELEYWLLHKSGQYLADTLVIPVTQLNAQGVGSAITYARRYSLAAIAGVAPEDDDGEAAIGRPAAPREPEPVAEPQTVVGKVAEVTQRPSNAGGMKYFIRTVGRADKFGTLKKAFAETAKAAKEASAEIEITYRETRWGLDVIVLRDLSLPEPEL